MSSSRWIRFSPKPGAWMATHWKSPFTWLCTSICSAVPSTDSAMIASGLGWRMMLSSTGMRDLMSVILCAVSST